MTASAGGRQSAVVVRTVADYSDRLLQRSLGEAVEALGGMGSIVRPGDRVLLKPNLLYPSRPEQAIVTHPAVVGAAARLVRDAGGIPLVGDSPPFRSAARVLARSGFSDVLRHAGVEIAEFTESRRVPSSCGRYPFVEIAVEVLDADVVLNLPKWKTHAQMILTLAVKNLFGCVVGNRKPEWHFRTGEDHDLFGEVIFAVSEAVNPQLTILDGILAMEGDGPGTGGAPTRVNRLLVSRDAVAVDVAVCSLIGLPPVDLPVLRAARAVGKLSDAKLIGDIRRVEGFELPGRRSGIVFGPRWLGGFFRKRLSPRPDPDVKECRACGDCVRYCPARAMEIPEGAAAVTINREACIRCFCCLEVCPHGAMRMRQGPMGRWFSGRR